MPAVPSALLLLLLLTSVGAAAAAGATGAAAAAGQPPRGFNSWNSYAQWVSAADLLAQAEVMETAGLRAVNFTYIVADGGWYYDPVCGNNYTCEAIDEYGRLIPDQGRYPDGWKGLCDELHAKGFKCGFHLFRGVSGLAYTRASPIKGSAEGYTVADAGFSPTSNNSGIGPVQGHGAFFEINMQHPAATQYLDSMFELYCSWGVDFIKLDGMGSSGAPGVTSDGTGSGKGVPVSWPHGPRMNPANGGVPVAKAYRAAIEKNCKGREVILSLSAGGTGIPGWQNATIHDMVTDEFVEAVQDVIQMTRVTPDTWDIWDDTPDQTACPLAEHWTATMGKNRDATDPKYQNVTGHSGCCWGGRIAQHFLEFANIAHIADKYGVFPDGDMLQIGRVGSYPDLQPETLAQYASPPFTPNNCSVNQLIGNWSGGPGPIWQYDIGWCPRQSYLTYEESKSLVTLWSIARSPLIMGGDLTRSPPEIVALLANQAVMEMNSHSENAHEVLRDDTSGSCVWASTPQGAADERYVALFNLGPKPQLVDVTYSQLGMAASAEVKAADLWKGSKGLEVGKGGVQAMVPRHGAVLLRLRAAG